MNRSSSVASQDPFKSGTEWDAICDTSTILLEGAAQVEDDSSNSESARQVIKDGCNSLRHFFQMCRDHPKSRTTQVAKSLLASAVLPEPLIAIHDLYRFDQTNRVHALNVISLAMLEPAGIADYVAKHHLADFRMVGVSNQERLLEKCEIAKSFLWTP